MANILSKGVKLKKKEHLIKFRILGLKGATAYLLKTDTRSGNIKPYTILATFSAWIMDEDKYRSSLVFRFAANKSEIFTPFSTARTMREIASIATQIAVVEADGDSTVYQIRKGDEWTPMFLDWQYSFYATLTANTFVPSENADA